MPNTQPRERPSRVSWKDKTPAVFAIGGEKHWNCRKWREDVQNLSKHSCNSCQSSPQTRMQQETGWEPRFCYRKVLTVTKTFQISLTTLIIKVAESRFESFHVDAGCNEFSETDKVVEKHLPWQQLRSVLGQLFPSFDSTLLDPFPWWTDVIPAPKGQNWNIWKTAQFTRNICKMSA